MSQQQTDDEREKLWEVQSAVAAANAETADAVTRMSGMIDTRHPMMDLSNTRESLVEAYRETTRALDRVELTMDQLDEEYGSPTPRQIKDEHAERLKEHYEGPVLNLALMLLERNRRYWLHHRADTNGAQAVERHGLTENQRNWLGELSEAWDQYDSGMA